MDKLIELIKELKDIVLDRASAREVTVKGVADFVTSVDMSVQEFLYPRLKALYPDVQFMSEEKENLDIDMSGKVWILDPVDGTTNLIHDYKMSAVSLALADNGVPVLGIIYNPFTDEIFTAKKGEGAYLNGEKISVTSTAKIENSLISIGTSPYYKYLADEIFNTVKKFYLAAEDIRRSGSAALDLCYIACGRTDGYFERNLKPWDYAAGVVVLREAGGIITDFDKNEPSYSMPSNIVSSNGNIHMEMMKIINADTSI